MFNRILTTSMKLALVVVLSVVATFVYIGKMGEKKPEPRVRGVS